MISGNKTPRIELRSKAVGSSDIVLGSYAPQHLYVIRVDSNGDEWILRGGQLIGGFIGMFADDINVVNVKYKQETDSLHFDWDPGLNP